ncbi:MAG: ArnT family glycosyltransferase [Microgenomates group bacterium]
MAKKKANLVALILILGWAFFLRVWRVGEIPPGLFGDEVDTGYQAYSILKTGKDYFGNRFPVHFQSFGDWRVPLYIYFETIFVAIFGLRELAVRLPAVILGCLGILVVYFLTKKITNNEKVSLISSFLLAISPWYFHINRVGLEVNFLPILFPLGLLLFWKGLETRNIWFLFGAGIFWGLTPYAYSTPKLFLPLILVVLLGIWRKEIFKVKKQASIFLLILFVILLPMGVELFRGTSQARFLGISIFNNSETAERVRIARENCDYPGTIERILHNKVYFWFDDFVKNYLLAISPSFLFGNGDPNPRHSIGGRGEMYLWELPFLLIGIIMASLKAVKEKNKLFQFALFWLILAPTPAALTLNGGNHALRLFLFLPWLQILTALGVNEFFTYLKSVKLKILFSVFLGVIILISSFYYFHHYFVHYPKISGRWWNYGYKEIFDYINKVEDKYQKIYISPSWEPPIVFVLFYSRYSPSEAQKEMSISPLKIGRYYFIKPDLNISLDPQALYVLTPADLEKNKQKINLIKEIKSPDGTLAFLIFSSPDVKEK